MKKSVLSIVLLFGFSAVSICQEATGLGLAERRALKDYQEKMFPEIKKKLMTAVGFEVPLDIKWDQIAKPDNAEAYKNDAYWGTTIFKPLTAAITSITADKEGKDALKAKLKKIVIMHDENTAPSSNFADGVTWEAGVLTINFTPYTNADESYYKGRVEAIQKLLESKL